MAPTPSDLRSIISIGGNVVIDASQYKVNDLRGFVSAASINQAHIHLKNLSGFSATDIKSVATIGKGLVTLDFTE